MFEVAEKQSNLAELLSAHQAQLENLAMAWLAQGGISYEIRDCNGLIVGQWFAKHNFSDSPGLSVPIQLDKSIHGEIRLTGLAGPQVTLRLEAEANLLARLVKLEETLESVTNELVDKQDQLIALYDLNRLMRHQVTVDETLQSLAEAAVRIVGSASASALLESSSFSNQEALGNYPACEVASTRPFVVHELLKLGNEILLDDHNNLLELPPEIQNLLFVPIVMRDPTIAGLALFNKPGGFTSPDLKMVRAITQQGGAQLENVLLYQETLAQTKVRTELELAARLQLRLLPHTTPYLPGLDVYGHSKPALQVGGDFFDYATVANRPFMFAVGDITGKGLPAAMLMTMVRTVLHNTAKFIVDPSPQVVLSRLNDDLYNDFTELGMFSTVFMGQYLQAEQLLLYANAGHSPVVHCPLGGPAVLLESDGPPIGVLPMNLSENITIPFRPGDLLVVMSDGFSEATNPQGEFFGYERLLRSIEAVADLSAAQIGHSLFHQVKQFGEGQPQDDDQTIVVIKGVEA